jgi:cytoplasmic iron level regulating protein YaaA (DUF328/UPF0246 family)
MLFLLSPAKTLDFDQPASVDDFTRPQFLDDSEVLVERARKLSSGDIKALMKVSDSIADLNVDRFKAWGKPFNLKNAKQAAFAFKGDVYTGLAIESCEEKQVDYLQNNVRILSGLYGLLRPLDLMQPYRLEMGVKFENPRGSNLYQFWGDRITDKLNDELGDESEVINLASNEYFKSVKKNKLRGRLVTPVFKDLKNGEYKIISFYAKKARGLMVRYAADIDATSSEDLKGFNYEGYVFSPDMSDESTLVFTRDKAPK